MSQGGKVARVTAVLGLLSAVIVLGTHWNEWRKSRHEADVAEMKRREAEADLKKKQATGVDGQDLADLKTASLGLTLGGGEPSSLTATIDGVEVLLFSIERRPNNGLLLTFEATNRLSQRPMFFRGARVIDGRGDSHKGLYFDSRSSNLSGSGRELTSNAKSRFGVRLTSLPSHTNSLSFVELDLALPQKVVFQHVLLPR